MVIIVIMTIQRMMMMMTKSLALSVVITLQECGLSWCSRCELPHVQCLLDLWAGYHWKILQNTHVYVYYKYTNTFWSIWSGTSTCNCEDTQNLPHTQAIKYLSFYICSRISRIKRASLQPLNKKLLLEPKITQTVQEGGVLNSYFCFWHLPLSSVQCPAVSVQHMGKRERLAGLNNKLNFKESSFQNFVFILQEQYQGRDWLSSLPTTQSAKCSSIHSLEMKEFSIC